MKYKLIKLKGNKSVLVDESAEIKENTYYENNGVVFLSDSIYNEGNNPNNSNPRITDFNNKVIATINHSISLDVPMVIYEEWGNSWEIVNSELKEGVNPSAYRLGWLGKAAQQQETLYSKEDLINFANLCRAYDTKNNNEVNTIYQLRMKYKNPNQEYIELEKDHDDTAPYPKTKIKTNRVNGQLMAYIKKQIT